MVADAKRVLVVDDEEIIRESYNLALTDAGYVVRAVGSGREAVEACRTERFDVLLADLRMPDMDGLELSRLVTKEFPETGVLIITGYPTAETARRAAEIGVLDYLEKPISPERLSAATAAAAASSARRRASESLENAHQPADVETAAIVSPQVKAARRERTKARVLGDLLMLPMGPLIGLAYCLFFPFVAAGMAFVVLGQRFAKMAGWLKN